ncbi:Aste57867_1423 [Aphanomyces stellatus]|uniref:Aste57867_1423 protein n=1 Tax=Aphanomyces stellatus TaxID=120398 RepID=A0A485K523_9STRA|nr:hypothetical protein As57867_001422 [Aphanomyces stellatus]VFT78640.1 Aste57867_1423 [Aphanomyces stellatus]
MAEKRTVQPVHVEPPVAAVVPVPTPPPTPPTTFVAPVVTKANTPVATPPTSSGGHRTPMERRAEVDSLMVSLSVENAHLKQELERLKNAPTTVADTSLDFATHQIHTLSSQLVDLQMQCAMLDVGSNPGPAAAATAVDLALPCPATLDDAHTHVQTLLRKIHAATKMLEGLEGQRLRAAKAKADEAEVMALVETIQPVVTTVRHVVSYVPVVSYVVSSMEATAETISPQSWFALLQTSHAVVKSVTNMASRVLSRPLSKHVEADDESPAVAKLKAKMEALMDLNVEQAIQIKQLKEKLNESMFMHQSMQMKFLEDKLTHQMSAMRAMDDEKMKRMEDELGYTTACVNQLANAIVRGPILKDKPVVHSDHTNGYVDIQDTTVLYAASSHGIPARR